MSKQVLILSLFAMLSLVAASCGGDNEAKPVENCDCTIDQECPDNTYCDGCHCLSMAGDSDIEWENIIICITDADCPISMWCELDEESGENICKGTPPEDGDIENESAEDGDKDYPDYLDKCPKIVVSPEVIKFGSVVVGNSVTMGFSIKNDSNANVDLNILEISYNALQTVEYEIVDFDSLEFPITLVQGQQMNFSITYSPIDEGIDLSTLNIVSDACEDALFHLPMESDYKGNAFFCVDPGTHDFGNVDLGSPAMDKEFTISNCSDTDDGNKLLLINEIRLASGASPHFQIVEGMIDPLEPVQLAPGREYPFKVRYVPQTIADYFDPLRERVLIVNQSDRREERLGEVFVQGTAESSLLSVEPTPIDFGEMVVHDTECDPAAECGNLDCIDDPACCPRDQECIEGECKAVKPISLYNWSGNPIAVTLLQLLDESGGNACDEFAIDDYQNISRNSCATDADCPSGLSCLEIEAGVSYCHVVSDAGLPGEFNITYNPEDYNTDSGCKLRVRSTLPTQEYMTFDIVGSGRPPNEFPIARIALQSHGPEIIQPIDGIAQNTKLCFYGNISQDPDGTLMQPFSWRMNEFPAGSTATFMPMDTGSVNTCMNFDLPGDYVIELKVQDNDGCWSNTAKAYVSINGEQGLQLILNFDDGGGFIGQNQVDMDLVLESPAGGPCSDDNLLANHTCVYPRGEGVAIMSQWSNGAGFNGTTEDLRVSNPVDGPWIIKVKYVEDCQDWYDFLVIPFCASRADDNRFTVQIYDPNNWWNSEPLFPALQGTMPEKGSEKRWRIIRLDGVWRAPEPL